MAMKFNSSEATEEMVTVLFKRFTGVGVDDDVGGTGNRRRLLVEHCHRKGAVIGIAGGVLCGCENGVAPFSIKSHNSTS